MSGYAELLATVVVQVIVAVYVYGQLTERVRGLGFEIRDLKESDRGQDVKLDSHERRISHIEGRRGIALSED